MFYCEQHLPSFLVKAKKAGLLKTTESFKKVVEEGLQTLAEKSEELKTEAVEPEPVVEEPVKKTAKPKTTKPKSTKPKTAKTVNKKPTKK